jgi:hypothetical protein
MEIYLKSQIHYLLFYPQYYFLYFLLLPAVKFAVISKQKMVFNGLVMQPASFFNNKDEENMSIDIATIT